MDQRGDWILGVDLGTSNIAAAWAPTAGGEAEAVPLEHGALTMPSAVHLDEESGDGRLVVGAAALNLAEGAPELLIRHPKRHSARGVVALGGREVPLTDVVAAQLEDVLARARDYLGGEGPRLLVLTHPEAWSAAQREHLLEAGRRVLPGADAARLDSEPVAAARHYARRRGVPEGRTVGVFDFGGGTLDVAIVRSRPGGFEVTAARGDEALGGWDLDAALRRWVYTELEQEHPAAASWLRDDPPWSAVRTVEDSVRRAKESLSEAQSAVVVVPAPDGDVRIGVSRAEFERIVTPEVDRAVELTAQTIDEAERAGAPAPSALFLTGGASRVPLVHERLASLAPVAVLDDPKLVVAKGAVLGAQVDPPAAAGRDDRSWKTAWTASAVVLVLVVLLGVGGYVLWAGSGSPSVSTDDAPAAPASAPAAAGPATADVTGILPAALAAISTCSEVPGERSSMPGLKNAQVAECSFTTQDFYPAPTAPHYIAWKSPGNAKSLYDWMVTGFGESAGPPMRDQDTRRSRAYRKDGQTYYYYADTRTGLGIEALRVLLSVDQAKVFDRIIGG